MGRVAYALGLGAMMFVFSIAAIAQQAAEPAPPAAGESGLPEVEVIQKKAPVPAKKAAVPAAAKKAPPPEPEPVEAVPAEPQPVTGGIASGSVQMSPLAGSEIAIGKVPNVVGRASSADIARTGEVQATDVLQRTVPGVILSDAQGNVFQRTLQYRGYDSSPLNGAAQGLAVYQNGVRINEAFGDIVNWDFLPSNAIEGITIVGANPVFGLNAIGGAAVINMRDGFNFEGSEINLRAGSFGRLQGAYATGLRSGAWGVFLALEGIQDDGFRDFSEAEIKRMYADIGVKKSDGELHMNFTGADNFVGVTAAAPTELLDLDWSRTFTSPQTTDNEMSMISLNGMVKATETLSFGGVAYYRWFRQAHDDGNIADAIRCGDAEDPPDDADPDDLCLEEEGEVETARNEEGESFNLVDSGAGDLNFGVIDRTAQSADSYGFALQAVERAPLLGLPNQFLIGASYDHGKVEYTTSSELGFFLPRFAVSGLAQEGLTDEPFILDEPDDFRPRDITTENDYVGVYFVNAIDLTRQLALTVGGRYNWARLDLKNNAFDPPEECEEEPDEEGCEDKLTGTHNFERFNPMVGATYQVLPGLTLFGSYAEANRAPTAAELACADPEAPCLIESFLTADPPLEQVVSKTYELGLRGRLASWDGDKRLEWTAGLFHATNEDDIITVASETNGRGFFQNAGETQRQGVEASLAYRDSKWYAYANYSFVDATFRNALLLASPDHPNDEVTVNCLDPGEPAGEDDPRCIQVESGDRLPGIPRHKFKAGFDYRITSKWRFGADLIAAGHQVFFGDESNDAKPLSGYAKVDLHTSYDISDNIQVYGLIDNLFDSRYGLFGNFFGVDAANEGAEADGLGHDFFQEGNNRTITPAPPFAIYGGVRMRF